MNEFAKVFGRPVFFLIMDGDRVEWCYPLRRSLCGATDAAARVLLGKILHHKTANSFALSICHNCRAPRFGRTCDKEKAGNIHLESLMLALKGVHPLVWNDLTRP
ncbi:MAG TPA: DUF166 family protein [Methanospirillum sp.]|nr:DUF166 family protein [Methanospirillum sp.]HPP76843.1 DUF166 family protein [Methanospirillum sp.]